uniref:Shugoshin C-terminal domain-containing protein n=1 Tax=Populus davidiana TaxID=266767 RepID=A0A6M2ER11_9ROSI
MEGVPVLDTENINVAGDKIKGEKLEKGSLVGVARRKMLADISNLSQRNQYGKSQSVLVSKEHVEKLQRDIMALKKLVADRNKIIELSAIELQKLRVNYQQLQQQNLQLAQTNSQMLAELNAGKDKLKAYQHELGCKNGLLNAKKLELKEQTKKVRSQNTRNEVETIKGDKAAQFSQPEDNKPCNIKRKRQSKVQSLDSSAVKPGQTEENAEKKSICLRRRSAMFKSGEKPTEKNTVTKSVRLRRQSARLKSGEEPNEKDIDTKSVCLRRQSARFKSGEEPTEKDTDTKRICTGRQSTRVKSEDQIQEPAENLFQTDDAKFHIPPLHDDPVHESCPTSSVLSVKIESETGNSVPRFETQELRRTSFRPTRRAAEKVQTYKEIPINVKMRRNE